MAGGEIEQQEFSAVAADLEDFKNVDDFSEGEQTQSPTFSISSYGADYTVDSIVSRVKKGDFFVPPFQRSFVWNIRQSSRFIESLLMGLPVPGIFVFREATTNKHLIVDGQQRLRTLEFFYRGVFEKHKPDEKSKPEVFQLKDVREPWVGKTYENLEEADRRRLDDSVIHTTIFRQELPDNDQSVYEVFERINTGGIKLSAQEIRVCVNYGDFTTLIAKMNENPKWRQIYGAYSPRLKDQELILRFFAFSEKRNEYKRPLRSFLNNYMKSKKVLDPVDAARMNSRFDAVMDAVISSVGARAFRPEGPLNTAVYDAVTVGIAARIERNATFEPARLKAAYETLLENPEFRKRYARATADEDNVKERFSLALEAFANV
jgi:hypothetical protein